MHSLEKLFEATLRDVYYAEKAILKALPKMAKKATSKGLRAAFDDHHSQTQTHVERLEEVFEAIGKKAQGKKCPAIDGLVEEAEEIMQEADEESVCDAGLLAAAQAVEHYEIARYRTLISWASTLGMKDAARLLNQTLAEEKTTDDMLSELAETTVNVEAIRKSTSDMNTERRPSSGRS